MHVSKRGYAEQAGEAVAVALRQRPRRRARHLEPVRRQVGAEPRRAHPAALDSLSPHALPELKVWSQRVPRSLRAAVQSSLTVKTYLLVVVVVVVVVVVYRPKLAMCTPRCRDCDERRTHAECSQYAATPPRPSPPSSHPPPAPALDAAASPPSPSRRPPLFLHRQPLCTLWLA